MRRRCGRTPRRRRWRWENAEKEWRFYWEKFGKTWEHMGKPSIWGWDFGLLPGKTRGFLWNFGGFCLETLVIGIVSSFCQQQLGLKQQTLRNMRGWTSKHLDLRIHKWVVFVYGLGNNILIGLIARNLSELFDDHCCVILINSALADLDQERFMKLHKRLLIAKHCALLGQGPAVIAWNHDEFSRKCCCPRDPGPGSNDLISMCRSNVAMSTTLINQPWPLGRVHLSIWVCLIVCPKIQWFVDMFILSNQILNFGAGPH